MKKKRWYSYMCCCLLGAASLMCSCAPLLPNGDVERVMVGQKLPDFSVTQQNGEVFSSLNDRARPVLICFFQTSCIDCRHELPLLQQFYDVYGSRMDFVCISRAEGSDTVASFWKQKRLTLPVSAQTDKRVFSLFARRTIPRIYLADEKGCVRAVFVEKASRRNLTRAIHTILNKKQ